MPRLLKRISKLEKGTAEVILKSVLSLSDVFNSLDPIVRGINDANERKRLLQCLGIVMCELNAGIVLPIISQYPEMHPDSPSGKRGSTEIAKSRDS